MLQKKITLNKTIEDSYNWQYSGTVGLFKEDGNAYFALLS